MPQWVAAPWVYWLFGLSLGAIGLLAFIIGWFGDRWRHKGHAPRCWKCRYDLSGSMKMMASAAVPGMPEYAGPVDEAGNAARRASLTCPECGHVHSSRQGFYRLRRRWGRTILGIILVWISLYLTTCSSIKEEMREHGEPWYVAATPNTIRLLTWNMWDEDYRMAWVQRWLVHDGAQGQKTYIWRWQLGWLARKLAADLKSDSASHRGKAIAALRFMVDLSNPVESAAPVLLKAIDEENRSNRTLAITGFTQPQRAARFFEHFLQAYGACDDADMRFHLAAVLAAAAEAKPELRETVQKLAEGESDPHVRIMLELELE